MTETLRSFTFLIASGRRDGNSEILARRAAEALPAGTLQTWLYLADLPLPPFEDFRHGAEPFPPPGASERTLLDATLAPTDLVLAVPLYWYGLPASAKLYLDYWSSWLRLTGADFKARMEGKTLWGVSALSDEEDEKADPLVGTLRLTADYMKMRWGGVLLGHGNRPGDVLADGRALDRAATFFRGPAT